MDEKFATTISKVLPFLVNIDQHQYYTQAVIFFDLIFFICRGDTLDGIAFCETGKIERYPEGIHAAFCSPEILHENSFEGDILLIQTT